MRAALRRWLPGCGLLLGACSASLAADPIAPADSPTSLPTGDWHFTATLDGKPIGEHRFTVSGQGPERTVRSVASFDVKFLGFTAYRYRHTANERWRDGCLSSLDARTDDDGKVTSIKAQDKPADPGTGLEITGAGAPQMLAGCVMTFAYWNPAMQKQSQLLNPQTGRYEQVVISEGKAGPIAVRGQQVTARQVRITGPKDPIELWYSPQGEWLALDSKVGGRLLSYRLK